MRALICGSFDPPHNGHFDLIKRAKTLFDLTVGIAQNPNKTALFSLEERASRIEKATGCKPVPFTGMSVDFAKKHNIDILIRGVRTQADLERELELAAANRTYGIETLLLPTDPTYAHLSSSLIREIIHAGGDPSPFL